MAADARKDIREFLTLRRAKVTPAQAGLPAYVKLHRTDTDAPPTTCRRSGLAVCWLLGVMECRLWANEGWCCDGRGS